MNGVLFNAVVDVHEAVKFFLDNDLLRNGLVVGENLEKTSGDNNISGLPQETKHIPSVSKTSYKKFFRVPGHIL